MEGWSEKTIEDVAQVNMGQSPDSIYYNSEGKGLPFLQGCAEFTARYPETSVYTSVVKKFVEAGSILFSVRAPVGKINISDKQYCIGRGIAGISSKNIDFDYLYHLLINIEDDINKLSKGSTFSSINSTELKTFRIYTPDSPREQQKIASILSTIDKNIELTEQLIAKQKNIKTGLMHDLLSYGIDEKGQIRSPQTHSFIDKNGIVVPEEWEVDIIGRVFDIYSGSTPSTNIIEYWNGDINWITPNDLNKVRHIYINESERKITKSGLKSCSTTLLPKHTIVMSSRAPIGYLAISTNNFCTNQGCKSFIFKDKDKHITEFFLFVLSFYMRKIKELGTGTTFQEISKTDLLSVKIPFPKEKDEQQRIVDIILKQDQIISEQETKLEKLKSIKKGLMEDLLTGKVRVNY